MISAPRDRVEKYLLLTSGSSEEFLPFQLTMKNLHRQGYAENTIEQYTGHIARFIDFVHEAGMQLVAIPFRPNKSEYLALANRNILADQMDFLIKGFSKNMR